LASEEIAPAESDEPPEEIFDREGEVIVWIQCAEKDPEWGKRP
jgi:hypothetical protein